MFHLVEYQTDVLNALHDLILHYGYQARKFDSPSRYLDLVDSPGFEPPIALIATVQLPYMDGFQLAEAVRKKYSHQKIVLTSGYPEYEIAPEMRRSVCAILRKPFELENLAVSLATLEDCDNTATSEELEAFIRLCPIRAADSCPHRDCHR